MLAFLNENKDAFTALATVVGLLVFVFGYWQYRVNQKWRRNEFLAKEMKDFLSDRIVIETIRFFDYFGSTFEAKIDGKDTVIRVYHIEEQVPKTPSKIEEELVLLVDALNSNPSEYFSGAEQVVRDHIDHYLGYMERLCAFCENKLFSKKELALFIPYHIDLLNGNISHSQGYHEELSKYLSVYGYILTTKFLAKFPKSKFVQAASRS